MKLTPQHQHKGKHSRYRDFDGGLKVEIVLLEESFENLMVENNDFSRFCNCQKNGDLTKKTPFITGVNEPQSLSTFNGGFLKKLSGRLDDWMTGRVTRRSESHPELFEGDSA